MARYYRKRRPYRGRRRFKRRTYRKRDNFDLARSAWKGVMQIKRMINVEYKHHVVDDTGTAVTNSGTNFDDLCVIPLGDSEGSRDGVSIKPINFVFRYMLTQHASATNTLVRLVFLRMKVENDTAPTFADIFPATPLLKPKIQDKRFNSKILYDKYFTLCDTGQAIKAGTITLKMFGHINYDASDTTGDDKEAGGLYLLAISSEATNTPTLAYHSRLTFTDN